MVVLSIEPVHLHCVHKTGTIMGDRCLTCFLWLVGKSSEGKRDSILEKQKGNIIKEMGRKRGKLSGVE